MESNALSPGYFWRQRADASAISVAENERFGRFREAEGPL